MFRRVLILTFIGAIAAVGAPTVALAQSPLSSGSIAGRAIDAGGHAVASQRVELMHGSQVVNAGNTDTFGKWSFRDVKPGDYVVRVNVKGRISGVRVHLTGGQAVSGTLIVVSTASVSPQVGAAAGMVSSLFTLVPTMATVVAATATAAAIETDTTALNETILKAILQDLTPAERVAFATAVLAAVSQAGNSTSPFSQYKQQFTTIVTSGGNTVPTFPPPVAVS